MSLREVRALSENSNKIKASKTRSGKAIGVAMNREGSLERQVEQLGADSVIAEEGTRSGEAIDMAMNGEGPLERQVEQLGADSVIAEEGTRSGEAIDMAMNGEGPLERQVEQLGADSVVAKEGTRSGEAVDVAMNGKGSLESQVEQLRADLEIAQGELVERGKQLKDLNAKMQQTTSTAIEADNKANEYYEELSYLQQQLENERTQAELATLRTINELHREHQRSLQAEKERFDREHKKTEELMDEMRASFQLERESLLKKIVSLEENISCEENSSRQSATVGTFIEDKLGGNGSPPEGLTLSSTSSSRSQSVTVGALKRAKSTPILSTATMNSDTPVTTTPKSRPRSSISAGEPKVSALGNMESAVLPHSVSEIASSGTSDSIATASDVPSTVSKLIQAQIDSMAAQARAVAVQNLPALCSYTGEGKDILDDCFERWIEHFCERATVAGWNSEQKLYHLKFYLDKTASDVFRMLPEADKCDFDRAVAALQKRFKPADIEELRGLEFHHLAQGEETIEQLGMNIQRLGRKAFPTITGKDFDRLLKGRFFQALLVKWQRKLGAPKPDESFHQLYDRARMLEQYEKQYASSAQAQSEYGRRNERFRKYKPRSASNEVDQSSKRPPSEVYQERRCFNCKQFGHIRQTCPHKQEAPGKSRQQWTGIVKSVNALEDLTEEELEEILMERRLVREQQLLISEECSGMRAIQASENRGQAVGQTPKLDLLIEGVPITAMVDTGAESTIISRQVLHSIVQHKRQQGHPDLVLEKPTVRLYGKDGQKGGHELTITAQLTLSFSVDGKTASVPTFVQPGSEQGCILGMNLIPKLGIQLVRSNGESLQQSPSANVVSHQADVRLVNAVAIPCQHGKILSATVSRPELNAKDPCDITIEALGVSAHQFLVTSQENGKVLIPVQNYQKIVVHLEAGTQLEKVRIVDDDPIFVSLDQVRLCYPKQGNQTWTGLKRKQKKHLATRDKKVEDTEVGIRTGPDT